MSDVHANNHDYHLVEPSIWPLVGSLSAFIMAIGAVIWMKTDEGGLFGLSSYYVFYMGLIGVLYTMFRWWVDVTNEAEHLKLHTPVVQMHLRYGMILFISSEVMFFVAWFWAYFNTSLFPDDSVQYMREAFIGGVWPPKGVQTFDPWGLPLMNTLILLTSGATVTFAHHSLIKGDRKGLVWGLALTVALGMIFTVLQAIEYSHAGFSFSENIYGATFFMATGFHGFHVIVGTIFLAVILYRALKGHFTPEQHFGFEAAAWYWHFVDVVWLFLFIVIYVLGAGTGVEGAH